VRREDESQTCHGDRGDVTFAGCRFGGVITEMAGRIENPDLT